MKKIDFLNFVGAAEGAEYAPVAGMLRSGYGFAGYFNTKINEEVSDSVLLMNVRLVNLADASESHTGPRITDFNEFVEEIVQHQYQAAASPEGHHTDVYGKSIPLAAIPFNEISIIYPIDRISKMMEKLQTPKQKAAGKIPNFLDFDKKSVILKILRTKLW